MNTTALQKHGFLLINLGTPASPSTKDVRAYLNQFLMDGYVLDAPWPVRRLIVSAFILPFRPRRSAEAYASIWQEQGSPLLLESQALLAALRPLLPGPVALGMRYGQPSINNAVEELRQQGVTDLIIAPLYPHYADSTVTTSLEAAQQAWRSADRTQSLPVFYDNSTYIDCLASVVKAGLPPQWDHLLMSYHGLPERHLTRADPTGSHCLSTPDCCERASPAHATCYRHQVYATSKALAAALELDESQYSVSFQSRLGRLPWLTPYTDQTLAELPAQGVKHLAVVCPAFVADNLETLEEIGIQGRETFLAAGGESLHLIPCLNHEPQWVETLAGLLTAQTSAASSETSA